MELQLHKQKDFSGREILQENPALFWHCYFGKIYQVLLGVQTFTAVSASFKTESYSIQPNTFKVQTLKS